MRVFIFDGTPEELCAVPQLEQLIQTSPTSATALAHEPSDETSDDDNAMAKLILRGLNASPPPPSQRGLIARLANAYPDALTTAEAEAAAGKQIGGVIGGLGLRFKHVRGWPRRAADWPSRYAIRRETDADGIVRYRATPALVAAWGQFQTRG